MPRPPEVRLCVNQDRQRVWILLFTVEYKHFLVCNRQCFNYTFETVTAFLGCADVAVARSETRGYSPPIPSFYYSANLQQFFKSKIQSPLNHSRGFGYRVNKVKSKDQSPYLLISTAKRTPPKPLTIPGPALPKSASRKKN
jgi:hypothetical protein